MGRHRRTGAPAVLRKLFGGGGCLALALLASVRSLGAADWPQWRGPQRTGISAEAGWLSKWPAGGPKRLWQAQVGEGFASVAVAGGRLYTAGNAENQDTISCWNAESGRPVWRYPYPCGSGDDGNYGGPRATPVLDGGNVYTLSREAQALCLNATTAFGDLGKTVLYGFLKFSVLVLECVLRKLLKVCCLRLVVLQFVLQCPLLLKKMLREEILQSTGCFGIL